MIVHPNLSLLADAAAALRPALGDEMVFVGGATIALLVPTVRARWIRSTDDVDVIVPVNDAKGLAALNAAMRSAGFEHGTRAGDPICRWRKDDLNVDVMPVDAAPLGFTNRFYEGGYARAVAFELANGLSVRVMTTTDTFAAKTEAFFDRGAGDPWASADLEDLVGLLEGVDDLLSQLNTAPADVRSAARAWAVFVGKHPDGAAWLEGHLHPGPSFDARLDRLLNRLRTLATLT